jgi:membrane dipeptidase
VYYIGRMPIVVDAHLDLAYNAAKGRDVTRPAVEQPADGSDIATVGLPDLRRGAVGLICTTVFCMPSVDGQPGYRSADEACAVAQKQLRWYQDCERIGHLRFVRSAEDLPTQPPTEDEPLAAIMLMEGPDALRTPDDLPAWFDAGLRIVGLAWKRTRFAGGTDAPGPLTAEGAELIRHLDQFGIVHDASHLADESFWQAMERMQGPVMASHSNCRAIVPTDRQLSDDMIRAIVQRDGVIGINFYDKFLMPPDEYGKRRANLKDVTRHINHICYLAGETKHVAIGTDMDGGLGRNEIPEEIKTSADLPKLADELRREGFDEPAIRGIMGENWLRFFRRALPQRRRGGIVPSRIRPA